MRFLRPALAAALVAHAAGAGTLEPSKPSDVVTLTNGVGNPCVVTGAAFDVRILPDGTREAFAVPAGRVLVVTGIDFTTPTTSASDLQLFVEKTPDTSQIFVTSTAGGGSALIPNAIVGSGSTLCLSATLKGGGGASSVFAVVHGFLAKDK